MRVSITTVVVLLALMLAQSLWYFPQLPTTIATHFNGAGQADNWQAKGAFFILYWLIVLFLTALLILTGPLLSRLAPEHINLPHKDYWLASERRDESLQFLQRHFAWMAAGTLALFIAVLQTVMETNLQGSVTLDLRTTWLIVLTYLFFSAAWMALLLRRFSRPM